MDMLLRRRLMMQSSGGGGGGWLEGGIRQGVGAYIPLNYYATPVSRIEIDIEFGTPKGTDGEEPTIISSAPDDEHNLFTTNFGGSPNQYLHELFFWNNKAYGRGGKARKITLDVSNVRSLISMGYEGTSHIGKCRNINITLDPKQQSNANPCYLLCNSSFKAFSCSDLAVVYGVKWYEDNQLVRDLKPYQDGDIICLKDTITGEVYHPQGGVFTQYNV